MFWTGAALTTDPNISILAETAAFIIVLIESTGRSDKRRAALSSTVVDFFVAALSTNSFHQVVPKSTHAGLLRIRVDLVGATSDQDA